MKMSDVFQKRVDWLDMNCLDEEKCEHVAHAVNCHDEMVEALEEAQKRLRGAGMLGGPDDAVTAALAKAKGGAS